MVIDNKEAHYARDRLLCRSSVMILYMNDHNKAKHCLWMQQSKQKLLCALCVFRDNAGRLWLLCDVLWDKYEMYNVFD